MLRAEDERAIEDLFARLRRVEGNSGPRDAEAEALIRQKLSEHPAAAYYMAQAIIVQEAALRDQQTRLAELEEQAERGRSGFLGSIFGDEPPNREVRRRPGPWDRQDGGGFLAGAAQTALGVSGGLLLGSAIAGMFSGAAVADEGQADVADEPAADESFESGGDDWGGFDIGGEF